MSTSSPRVSGHFPTLPLLQAAPNTSLSCLFSALCLDVDHTEETMLELQGAKTVDIPRRIVSPAPH